MMVVSTLQNRLPIALTSAELRIKCDDLDRQFSELQERHAEICVENSKLLNDVAKITRESHQNRIDAQDVRKWRAIDEEVIDQLVDKLTVSKHVDWHPFGSTKVPETHFELNTDLVTVDTPDDYIPTYLEFNVEDDESAKHCVTARIESAVIGKCTFRVEL